MAEIRGATGQAVGEILQEARSPEYHGLPHDTWYGFTNDSVAGSPVVLATYAASGFVPVLWGAGVLNTPSSGTMLVEVQVFTGGQWQTIKSVSMPIVEDSYETGSLPESTINSDMRMVVTPSVSGAQVGVLCDGVQL